MSGIRAFAYVFCGDGSRRDHRPLPSEGGGEAMPPPTEAEIDHGVPLFLDQLVDVLRLGLPSGPEIGRSAVLHGLGSAR